MSATAVTGGLSDAYETITTETGGTAIWYKGHVFMDRKPSSTDVIRKFRCRAQLASFCKKHGLSNGCRVLLTVDTAQKRVVGVRGVHTTHPATWDDRYIVNYHRYQIFDNLDDQPSKNTHEVYDEYRRDHISQFTQNMGTYDHLKSSMTRHRRIERGPLPSDSHSMDNFKNGIFGCNIYGRPSSVQPDWGQQMVHQYGKGSGIWIWHTLGQNKMCKGMDHVMVDGTFQVTPVIHYGKQPFAQVLSIMVGKETSWGACQAYVGKSLCDVNMFLVRNKSNCVRISPCLYLACRFVCVQKSVRYNDSIDSRIAR